MKSLFKLNNKGGTFVTVIVSLGVLGVLATLVMVITKNSYVTKTIDNQSKNNFYNAEEVIDQLKIGLQNELCECMIDAYFKVIAEYNENDAESKRVKNFKQYTLGDNTKGFIDRISADSGTKVSAMNLRGLISEYYLKDSNDSYKIDVKKKTSSSIYYVVDPNFETLTIKNVGVEYYNEVGYVNGIFTDIVIDVPEPDFSMFEPEPNTEYEKYAIMADVDVNIPSGVLTTKGSVWIGNYANLNGSGSRFVTDGEYIYINGGVSAKSTIGSNGTYAFSVTDNNPTEKDKLTGNGTKALFCTGSLITDNSSSAKTTAFNINADTYLWNDLIFEGNNATVNISGTYYGFGQAEDDPNKNSSIIVNGRNNTLTIDATDLKLAGSSFIKTYNNGNYTVPNASSSILTGDSLSIRSNELAYLVPSTYMQGLPNPVTRTDLEASSFSSFDALKSAVVGAVTSDTNLRDLVNDTDPIDGPVKILYYTYSDDPNDRVAYFYLNFASATSGAEFYQQKVATNATTKNMLLGLIPVTMTVDSDNFGVGGMYVERLYADANGLNSATFTKGVGDTVFVDGSTKIYENMTHYLTDEVPAKLLKMNNDDELMPAGTKFTDKLAIDNIIDWNAINSDPNTGLILGDKHLNDGGSSILGYPIEGPNASKQLKVRIYKGDYTLDHDVTGIVIATGKINVKSGVTVNGLIVSHDTINIEANAQFIADPVVTRNVFNRAALVKTEGGVFLNKILNGFQVNNVAGQDVELSTLELEGMFSYENWCRN